MSSNTYNKREYIDQFNKALQDIIGLECWAAVAGKGTGSVVSFDIGKKIPRKKISSNPHLSELAKRYTGEYGLFVECDWRLDGPHEVICGSRDSNKNDGPMVTGLQKLIPSMISDIQLSGPAQDLRVIFQNGYEFKIFCDNTDAKDYEDNYSFLTPGLAFLVKSLGKIEIETYDEAD